MILLLGILTFLTLILVASAVFTAFYARRVERRFPPVGRFIEVEGCRLHYVDQGPSDPRGTVVILHGASSNLQESMVGLGKALSERYRVIAFDRPGHGWSRRGKGLAFAQPAFQARAIAAALRRLEVRQAVIVGHSYSGTIVPHFGLDHTDVAGALVVISGLTHPWPGGYMGWYRAIVSSWLGWLLARTVAIPVTLLLQRRAEARTFSPQDAPPGFLHEAAIPLALRPRATRANGQDISVMFEALSAQCRRYGEIRLPSLVMAGDRDAIVWTDLHAPSFARDVPGAELIMLPGLGHMPHYAQRERFLAAIDRLAARVEGEQAAL